MKKPVTDRRLIELADGVSCETKRTPELAVPEDEYLSVLRKYNENLVNLFEKLSALQIDESSADLFELIFSNLRNPVCVADRDYTITYCNSCWELAYPKSRPRASLRSGFTKEDNAAFERLRVKTNNFDSQILNFMPFSGINGFLCALPFSSNESDSNFLLLIQVENESVIPSPTRQYEVPKAVKYQVALLNHFNGFYLVFERDGNLSFVSAGIQQVLGYDAVQFREKYLEQIVKDISKFDEGRFKELLSGFRNIPPGADTILDVSLSTLTGQCRWFEMKFSEFEDSGELLVSFSDIHSRKLQELESEAARKTAERNDQLKSEFLANMSHEIRTPLNGIVGFSTMLDRTSVPKDKREKYLSLIRSSTKHLLSIVNDIIDISKIEAGQLKIAKHALRIHSMLDELMATFSNEIHLGQKTGLRLILKAPLRNEELIILSDEVRLRQVFTNLLNNALKFTERGEISFGYEQVVDGRIAFFVSDTGAGISKSNLRSIFRRYKQTAEGGKSKYEGTGLGLAISKGIVELLGGKLTVESSPGEGSIFRFFIPLPEEVA